MKRFSNLKPVRLMLAFLLALTLAFVGVNAVEQPRAEAAYSWKIKADEEFDSWKPFRWNIETGKRSNDNACMIPDNIFVNGGYLRITTAKDSNNPCGTPYTTGGLDTYKKLWIPKYFKITMRARVSQEQGIQNAPLWLRPGNANGPTTPGGEIDVVEAVGNHDYKAWTTLHPDYSQPDDYRHVGTPYANLGDSAGTGFHVYRVEKTPGNINFWIDGKHTAHWSTSDPSWYGSWMEQQPNSWSLRVNALVDTAWSGHPDCGTDWGWHSNTYIDYIRVYTLN